MLSEYITIIFNKFDFLILIKRTWVLKELNEEEPFIK